MCHWVLPSDYMPCGSSRASVLRPGAGHTHGSVARNTDRREISGASVFIDAAFRLEVAASLGRGIHGMGVPGPHRHTNARTALQHSTPVYPVIFRLDRRWCAGGGAWCGRRLMALALFFLAIALTHHLLDCSIAPKQATIYHRLSTPL